LRAIRLFARRRMIDEHRRVYQEVTDNATTWAKQNLPTSGIH
jgi:hypothetical protein